MYSAEAMQTQLMGILNITPDSFSDGGEYYHNPQKAVARAQEMLTAGADIIDIGGESTRPGADLVSAQEEINRVLPVITAIKQKLPNATLSIDTWKHEVADAALTSGCTRVNSLGGLSYDPKLATIIAKHQAQIVIYHIKGKPKTMQQDVTNADDVIKEITDFFTQQLALGEAHGIQKDRFILDPGIGFGKTLAQNLEIIRRLREFQQFELPLAIGVSRKSHLGMLLKEQLGIETTPTERLEAGLAETAIAVQNGATIIRTHDVLATKKFLATFELLQ